MAEDRIFESYKLITKLSGRIITKSPMRIGAGRGLEVLESDLPIVKNTEGVPIIPGSSLKGFFRGTLQRILYMKFSNNKVESLLKEVFGGKEKGEWASAVLFHELKVEANKYKIAERKHIAIDPEKGSVRNLFDVECVMDGSVFSGCLLTARNLSPKGLALIKTVIDATNFGLAKLGGFKSRGYGSIEIMLDELRFILPGKSADELREEVVINDLVPKKELNKEKLNSARFRADSKVWIDDVEVEAQINDAPPFFGVEIVVKEDEISKLLDELLKVVV
jgi:CRISPR-associated protein Csm3